MPTDIDEIVANVTGKFKYPRNAFDMGNFNLGGDYNQQDLINLNARNMELYGRNMNQDFNTSVAKQKYLEQQTKSLQSADTWNKIGAGMQLAGLAGNFYTSYKTLKEMKRMNEYERQLKQRQVERQNQMDRNLAASVEKVYGK